MAAIRCSGTSPHSGKPCKLAATHVWDGKPACRWHGDPARREAHRRRHHRFCWDAERLEVLYGLVERGLDDAAIGARLGCSAEAVHLARRRNGIPSRSRLTLSARDVAEMLGKGCAKSVVRWIEAGWLKGRRAYRQGPHRVWIVAWGDLEAFVRDEDHWHRYEPERIAHPWLRRLALEARGGLRFLAHAEVAAICGVERDTVGNWLDHGWLRCQRDGNRVIRSDWLEEFRRHWSYEFGYTGLRPAERDEVSARLAAAGERRAA